MYSQPDFPIILSVIKHWYTHKLMNKNYIIFKCDGKTKVSIHYHSNICGQFFFFKGKKKAYEKVIFEMYSRKQLFYIVIIFTVYFIK